MMNITENSLRFLVEKWLVPTRSMPFRVTEFSRARSNQRRYVCVEVMRAAGPVGIFFFRHSDGTWNVFPDETERLAIRPC
jgi:hypothetical protein